MADIMKCGNIKHLLDISNINYPQICGRRFARSDERRRHTKIHMKDRGRDCKEIKQNVYKTKSLPVSRNVSPEHLKEGMHMGRNPSPEMYTQQYAIPKKDFIVDSMFENQLIKPEMLDPLTCKNITLPQYFGEKVKSENYISNKVLCNNMQQDIASGLELM